MNLPVFLSRKKGLARALPRAGLKRPFGFCLAKLSASFYIAQLVSKLKHSGPEEMAGFRCKHVGATNSFAHPVVGFSHTEH